MPANCPALRRTSSTPTRMAEGCYFNLTQLRLCSCIKRLSFISQWSQIPHSLSGHCYEAFLFLENRSLKKKKKVSQSSFILHFSYEWSWASFYTFKSHLYFLVNCKIKTLSIFLLGWLWFSYCFVEAFLAKYLLSIMNLKELFIY